LSCQYCSQTPDEHKQSHVDTLMDLAALVELGAKNPEYKDLLDRLTRDWRTHALPPCNDFAYN